jgi:uncharacterized protein
VTADEVLRRYREEELPEFVGLRLMDVNEVGNFGNSALKVAAVRGILEEVMALLDGGADPNKRGEHGFTALHHAVSQEHIDVVRVLLERGASLTVQNDWAQTPRDIAVLHERPDIESLLSPRVER